MANIQGTQGDDTLTDTDFGDDVIEGFAGNDTITSNAGVDFVDGGTGFDILEIRRFLTATGVVFTLNGAAGSDGSRAINIEQMTFLAGTGNDTITGADGGDELDGNDGN